mmetsp:Transcript_32640/g.59187  ORF Transcript_32640/g.59187 Transcript_32640/m.59187 type:complete len:226 (+) Transcript_32640:459-1136(+)
MTNARIVVHGRNTFWECRTERFLSESTIENGKQVSVWNAFRIVSAFNRALSVATTSRFHCAGLVVRSTVNSVVHGFSNVRQLWNTYRRTGAYGSQFGTWRTPYFRTIWMARYVIRIGTIRVLIRIVLDSIIIIAIIVINTTFIITTTLTGKILTVNFILRIIIFLVVIFITFIITAKSRQGILPIIHITKILIQVLSFHRDMVLLFSPSCITPPHISIYVGIHLP